MDTEQQHVEDVASSPEIVTPRALAVMSAAIVGAVFILDTMTPAENVIAVLYVGVVLLSTRFLQKRGIVLTSLGLMGLTVLSYLLSEDDNSPGIAFSSLLLSVAAIGATAFLAVQTQSREMVLREQAGLLDLTHDTIFVRDMNDVIVYWNRGAEELYAWKKAEALGKVSHQLMRTTFPAPLEQITAELLRTGRWEGELVHTKKDGTQAVVASRWSVRRDAGGDPIAILETNNDITERKHAEDALRRSDAYLAEAQKLSLTGSFGWKISSGELFWSEESFRILGYDRTIKPSLEHFILRSDPVDIARVRQQIDRAARDGKDWELEHQLLMPDDTVKCVHVVARAVRDESGAVEFVGAIMDVSATRRAEHELRQAQAELAHVTRVTTLGELTASIAHEVNQPITGVITNAAAALRWLGADPPNLNEVRDILGRIVKDGGRAGDVLHRIRALIKKAPPRMVRLDINEVVLDIIALTRSELQRHNVSLRTELAAGLPLIEGDRIQLQQVILNLILNAVDAMRDVDEGTRELQISTGREDADSVLVTVRDCGPGLDPQSADRLFEAFYTTKPDGLGMGLPICRSIIEAHGGRLWVTGNDPRGAVFQFTLTLERDDIFAAEELKAQEG
ncbi:PAS domain-containing sensor histidine kinase [Bradyrhizobium sp. SYSU BS000235]|uniref:PAS domain-containing sensor histidine kinase n=1 Tax=Bradyrhizobium sp. SYSU BS000235 TaxID=3411332 RepID=UPI003C78EA2A